jgi:hypothetical protein
VGFLLLLSFYSHRMTKKRTMKTTKEHLESSLLALGVPLELWGINQAKTLDHLVKEINDNECRLVGLERTIYTVVLDVKYRKFVLHEKE